MILAYLEYIFAYINFNHQATELFNLIFQYFEVVFHYRDPHLQVTEKLCDL